MKGGTITLNPFSSLAGLYDAAAVCPLTVGSVSVTHKETWSGKTIFIGSPSKLSISNSIPSSLKVVTYCKGEISC